MLASTCKGTVSSFFTYWDGPNWSEPQWNEIDVEVVPSVTTQGFSRNLIYGNGAYHTQDQGYLYGIDETQWHTYAIEWRPNSVKWFVDGQNTLTLDSSHEGVRYMNKY